MTGVQPYNARARRDHPMDDALVPVIQHDQLEAIATDFLQRYYPEALKEPMDVSPDTLAKRMGLKVTLRHITEDCSVFGLIHFIAGEAEYFDKDAWRTVTAAVDRGEIFVDPDVFFLRNLGSVNNTIIHECVHWDKHRKAFELERLYNAEATRIKCRVEGGLKDNNTRLATEFMEWQANALTPRIQMSYTQTKVKAYELIQKYKHLLQTDVIVDVMEAVIDELAAFFGVSRAAAKIRLVDLGFEEAIGTFTYIDGRYVRPHGFKKGALDRKQTFSLALADALAQATLNMDLRMKIQSGNFLYVDSRFVVNHPKYISADADGTPYISEYARLHTDECCLVFDLNIKTGSRYGKDYYTECVLCRDASSDIVFEARFNNDKSGGASQIAESLKAYTTEISDVMEGLPNSFCGTLQVLMKWRGVTNEVLAEAAGVSAKTIQRLRNDGDNDTSLETIIAVCIGMKLPPTASYYLIDKSNFSLNQTPKHQVYRFLLNGCYTYSIDDCNAILIAQDFEPLSVGDT